MKRRSNSIFIHHKIQNQHTTMEGLFPLGGDCGEGDAGYGVGE